MAVELIAEQAPERPAALTARGQATVHLLRFEDAWAELGADDRRYFAEALEQFARQSQAARQEGGSR